MPLWLRPSQLRRLRPPSRASRGHRPRGALLLGAEAGAAMDMATAPTGLKGKLAALEDFISMKNEELAAQRQEIESLRNDKSNIEEHYQGQLMELKKTMVADVQRMQEECKRHFSQQKAENQRLQQQITTLKGEKTSLQQQILGLQRRIQEVEEHT